MSRAKENVVPNINRLIIKVTTVDMAKGTEDKIMNSDYWRAMADNLFIARVIRKRDGKEVAFETPDTTQTPLFERDTVFDTDVINCPCYPWIPTKT